MKAIAFVPAHNSPNKRDATGAFQPECRRFMRVHAASQADIHPIDNSRRKAVRKQQVLDVLDRYSGCGLDAVAFFCHGQKHTMQLGFSRANVADLAKAINAACSSLKPAVPLYLCWTGGGKRGGAKSFADALRDALCALGAVHCRVMGHATRGHTTRNPASLFFDGNGSPIGGVGGYWVVDRESPQWRKWVRALRGEEKGLEELRFRFPFMTLQQIHSALAGGSASAEPGLPAPPVSEPPPLYHVTDSRALIRRGPPRFRSRGRTIPVGTEVYVTKERNGHGRAYGVDGRDHGWTKLTNLTRGPRPASAAAPSASVTPAAATEPLSAAHIGEDVYTVVDKKAIVRGGPTAFKSTDQTIPRYRRLIVLDRQGRNRRVAGVDGKDYQWTRASNLHIFHRDRIALLRTPLPAADPVDEARAASAKERKLAGLHNRTGGLMSVLAKELRIDVGAVYAVWMVESNGRRHTRGKALIRFENHLFHRRWGEGHETAFRERFRFGGHQGVEGKPWMRHQVRLGGAWRKSHSNQDREYEVLALAQSMSDEATALCCISIGGPQILISNHRRLGYPTPREMFDAFQESERFQILGFFDFCNGRAFDGKLIKPLRKGDFRTFARSYNGRGKAELYGDRIQDCFDAAQSLGLCA